MKKAQPKEPVEILASTKELEKVLPFMNAQSRNRQVFVDELTKHKESIVAYEASIASMESDIERYKKNIEVSKKEATKVEKKLSTLPESGYGLDQLREELSKVAQLAWIQTAFIKDTKLYLTTRPGILKTTFNERIVYKGGSRAAELLPEPLSLPLPTYEIVINLANMGGGRWALQPSCLGIKLAMASEYQSFIGQNVGWNPEPHAHWAHNAGSSWGGLCLGSYDNILRDAGVEGLDALLTAIVEFLQLSGWASAYRPKLSWAVMLGNPIYNQYLTREAEEGENLADVQKKNRDSLPAFLEENNITLNEYTYGAPADEEIGEIYPED